MFDTGGGYDAEKRRREEEMLRMSGMGGAPGMNPMANINMAGGGMPQMPNMSMLGNMAGRLGIGGGGGRAQQIPMGAIRGRLGQYGNAMNDFFQKYNMDYTDLSKILNLQNDQLGNIATNMNQIPGMINQQMQPDPQISSLIGNLPRGRKLAGNISSHSKCLKRQA